MSKTIDFYINGLSAENRLRSQRTPKPYEIKVNNRKLKDLVIELTKGKRTRSEIFSLLIIFRQLCIEQLLYIIEL